MYYTLDESFLTGCKKVDDQHKQLFDAINTLLDAYEQKKGEAEFIQSLDFLNQYTINHFFDEEQILKKYGFSDLAAHQQFHAAFTKRIRDISRETAVGGGSASMIQELQNQLGTWLIDHIKGQDFRWAAELKEKAPELFTERSAPPARIPGEAGTPKPAERAVRNSAGAEAKPAGISVAAKMVIVSSILFLAAVSIMTTLCVYSITAGSGLLPLVLIPAALALFTVSVVLNFSVLKMWIINPLKKINAILQKVENGDISREIPAVTKDEIGELAVHLNCTLGNLKHLVLVIRDEAEALDDIGQDLSANMDRTTGAMGEIGSAVRHIQQQIAAQSDSISATNTAMEQITGNIGELSSEIEIQSSSVSQSSSAIEEMLATIDSVTRISRTNTENVMRLAEASEIGRAGLEVVAKDMQEIARESEGLLEINGVLQNIASQTNFLSMNAAIEAAHAGEIGKGFAVVADEIRKLAESSGTQSRTISRVLRKIRDSITKISAATGEVQEKFKAIDTGVKTVSNQEELIRNAMEEQSMGSRQILDAVGKLNEITQRVKQSSAEMRDGSKEIIDQGASLEKAAKEIAAGMNEMAYREEEVNSSVIHVNSISQKNQNNIEVLKDAISHFIVVNKHYIWDDSLLLGVEKVDDEHKQLFDSLNSLIDSIEQGAGKEEVRKSLDYLLEYTKTHFQDEEEVQLKSGYPGYKAHHDVHVKFTKTVQKLARDAVKIGNSEDMVRIVEKQIGDWLVDHVKGQDSKIGSYIKARQH
ncbi:MAG: bacteriohemerythrin [Treponema sp.]|nr:bacteriohemerythrin [Treponema sp.]